MTEKQMFDFLVAGGIPEHGAAVLLGHFQAESGLNPRNLQNSANNRLNISDDEYTAVVDAGAYPDFINDKAGYGLAQWTYWSRKKNLLEFARNSGCSIGDPEMQLRFVLWELNGYKAVLQVLKTETNIRKASDVVLEKYEQPADQSEAERKKRAGYAQEIYDRCAGTGEEVDAGMTESQIRQRVVDIAVAWYGRKEADGSHRVIIDTYNGHAPLARGYKVKYTDAWCATFGSSVAIVAGYTDIIPTECGCGQMIALFQALNRWVENDAYLPDPGDYVFYDWDDNGVGDCTGWPEHVGIVVFVTGNKIKVIEGNKNNAVEYRELTVNGRYIRGYGIPDYASKATKAENPSGSASGTGTGSGISGSICMSPQWVGVVTGDNLNVRKWAGTEYDNIKSWPKLSKGNLVDVCDSVKAVDGSTWYYIRIDGRIYGFVHSDYITRSDNGTATSGKNISIGTELNFTGSTHYTSSGGNATGKRCKPGRAKVTAVNMSGVHQYHLVAVRGGTSTVYGWVDASDISS